MREFNVTGLCIPGKHYMVDISEKVRQTATMVEKGQYFTINRARQYGKTTTIRQLEKVLLEREKEIFGLLVCVRFNIILQGLPADWV